MTPLRWSVIGLLALAPAAASAAAAPAWHATVPILAGEVAGAPAAATADGGESLVLATRQVGGRFVVQALSRRAPRGIVGAPVTISSPAARPFGGVAVAVGPRGDAVAAWITPAGAVQASRRTGPAGTWRRVALSGTGAASVRVARHPAGRCVVIWTRRAGSGWRVEGAAAPSLAGGFAPLPPLDADASASAEPRIALAPDDDAAAATWIAGADTRIRASRLDPGAVAWESPEVLSGPGAADPDVAVDPGGGAAVAWTLGGRVEGAARAALAPTWRPLAISSSGSFPHVALSGAGQVIVQWAELAGSRLAVRAATVAPGAASPGPVTTVYDDFEYPSAILKLQEARIAGERSGGAVLTWPDPAGPGSETLFAAVLHAGAWSAPRPLIQYEGTGQAVLCLTPDGDALVVAAREGLEPDLRAALYDRRPPVLVRASVRGPSSARLGGRIAWAFRIANPGRVPALGVVVSHYLPTGMGFVGAVPAPRVRTANGERRWRIGTIPAGGTRAITLITTSGTRTGPRLSTIVVSAGEVPGFTATGQAVLRRGAPR